MSDFSFPLRRTFVALPIEKEAKWHFQALQEELKSYSEILRFQNQQSPHLTLQYWNEVMEIEFHRIVEQVEKMAVKSTPFTLKCTGVSTFGSHGEDRVLFLDVAFSEELARLKKLCPWQSEKPFSPHITLARIGHSQRFAVQKKKIFKVLENSSFEISIDRLRLYAEIDGVKQTPIDEYLFQ